MSSLGFNQVPGPQDMVRFATPFGPHFIITVDTEEEFDWAKPLARTGHSVDSVPALREFQAFCAPYGIRPIYLVDHPIIADPQAARILAEFVRDDEADIGIQLHPWVSPPFDEDVIPDNSFAGNLPRDLEAAKLAQLRDRIESATGKAPLMYRAGRYGVGPNTPELLRQNGVQVDSSVRARFDYSGEGGPCFRQHPLCPYWIDREAGLMELPLTTVYWGMLRQQGRWLYPQMWRTPRMRGVLARLGLLERIALTPEGISVEEAIKGIDIALDDGVPILNFSFHSPSLAPGYTPYVRSKDDLARFYDWWERILAYLDMRGVRPISLQAIIDAAAPDGARTT